MKKFITILIFVGLVGLGSMASVAQTCSTVPIGLVAAYSGDGNSLDARSRNNGTNQSNVTYIAGKVGQAIQLGGSLGDRVLAGNPANLRAQNFTLEAWVKRSSSAIVTNSPNGSGAGLIFSYGNFGWGVFVDQATNKLSLTRVGSFAINSNLTITDTNWHHIAISKDFTGSGTLIFYLDGVADAPIPQTGSFDYTTNAAIGTRGDAQTDNAFFGAVDELAIYNRVLTPTEIQSIFNSGTMGKCKPIATYAPDNQVLWLAGDGDALDATGNVGGATLQNGAGYQVGKVGQGFTFDGVDDQITVPHNANQNGGTNLTIDAWVNAPGSSGSRTILQKRSSANLGGYTLEYFGNQSLQFCVQISGTYQCLAGANIITNGVWSHVAATYDGAAMRVYINGTQILIQAQTGAIDAVSNPIVIGRNVVNNIAFQGSLDEIGVYNRALSAAEIQSISNAGLAGKYKVQATVPANIAAWYPGDGNTNDLQAANNATLNGGATYAGGKVGQAFSLDGTTAYVSAPSTAANDPTGANSGASMEAWFYLNQLPSAAGHPMFIMSKSGTSGTDLFEMRIDPDDFVKFLFRAGGCGPLISVQTGIWYHVIGTSDLTTGNALFYINGVLACTAAAGGARTVSGVPLDIGHSTTLGGSRFFNGLIDEPAIYNRTLTANEIRDLYYAQNGGKSKGVSNPTVSNRASVGDATLTFSSFTSGGAAHQTPLDLSLLPPLPAGASSVGLTYDISSTVISSGNTTVCFQLPALTSVQFSDLGVLHLESGVWIDRATSKDTANRIICASSASLSPFAIARGFAPSAAPVSVSGRVLTVEGRGISGAVMKLTDSQGVRWTTRTSAFGYYKFDDLPSGQTYILDISSKRYIFTPSSRVISLEDEITDADFIADEPQVENKRSGDRRE